MASEDDSSDENKEKRQLERKALRDRIFDLERQLLERAEEIQRLRQKLADVIPSAKKK